MRAGHRQTIEAVKIGGWSPELRCDYRRTVAHRAVCQCGWRSKACGTVREARALAAVHLTELEPAQPEG